ncbi:MAG: hypothetical protein FJ148_23835 [Deltaproteobacteria bacterium]|nr:hypothetical protein [Deltaproteobacteria bacterium]
MSALSHGLDVLRVKVLTTLLRRVVVLVRALDRDGNDFPLPEGFRLAVLAEHDLGAYRAFRPDQEQTLLDERLARGDLCFAVLAGETIVHATWASSALGPLPYLAADARLLEGDVCLYDSYTERSFRARDLSRSRDELCRRHYRARGLRRSVALIARENVAGLRTAEPLGYRPIGEYGWLRLGSLERRWSTSSGSEPLPVLVPRRSS